VVDSFKWILVLLLILVGISGKLIPKYILDPFKHTLRVIQTFDLKQKQRIRLPHTRTHEFKELNRFLEKMTDKALEDYRLLKEFTENASHELQTPTAILRGKLELLTESDIRDEQAKLIEEMYNALEKLSRIHSSLTQLTRIDNYEYEQKESICFSKIARETLASLDELIQMKGLGLRAQIEENIYVPIPQPLAELMLNNLLSNSIRHNVQGGNITVVLNKSGLLVANTGKAPLAPTSELFQRFKKGDQSGDSVGIGLAIVKQICDLNGFAIIYEYARGRHFLAISFDASIPASKLLQNDELYLHSELQV
jgi:signal transduction histidine kinase